MAFDPSALRAGSVFSDNPNYLAAWVCYINGQEVPAMGWDVTYGVWQIPSFRIHLVPDELLIGLGREDRVEVAIFYLDYWSDPDHPEPRLLVDGEIVGWSFNNSPGGRVMSFQCEAHIGVFKQLYFFYMTNVDDVVAAQSPEVRANAITPVAGLLYPYSIFRQGLTAPVGVGRQVNDDPATRNRLEGYVDVEGQDDASTHADDEIKAPYELVNNITKGCISAAVPPERRSVPAMNFFSRHIRKCRFHNRFVRLPLFEDADRLANRQGVFPIFNAARNDEALQAMQRQFATRIANQGPIWQSLQQILSLVYMEIGMIPNPACVQVALADAAPGQPQEGKILRLLTSDSPLQQQAAPDPSAARITQEAHSLAEQLRALVTSSPRSVRDQSGTQQTQQQMLQRILDAVNRETNANLSPSQFSIFRSLELGTARPVSNQELLNAFVALIQRVGPAPWRSARREVNRILQEQQPTVPVARTPAEIALLQRAGLTATPSSVDEIDEAAIARHLRELANAPAPTDFAAHNTPPPPAAVTNGPSHTGLPPLEPARLAQYFVKPQFMFGIPPHCNVFFPSMIVNWGYDENYINQPTRVYVNDTVMTRLLRADHGANRDLMVHALSVGFPEEANALMQHKVASGGNGPSEGTPGATESGRNLLVWPEEYYKGPVTARMDIPSWLQMLRQFSNAQPTVREEVTGFLEGVAARIQGNNGGAAVTPTPGTPLTGPPVAAPTTQTPVIPVDPNAPRAPGLLGRQPAPRSVFCFRRGGNNPSGYQFHDAVDAMVAWGTPVYAPVAGRVIEAVPALFPSDATLTGHRPSPGGGGGIKCKISHASVRGPTGGVIRTGYAHLSVLYVRQDQQVRAGELIGLVGSTAGYFDFNGVNLISAYGRNALTDDVLRQARSLPFDQGQAYLLGLGLHRHDTGRAMSDAEARNLVGLLNDPTREVAHLHFSVHEAGATWLPEEVRARETENVTVHTQQGDRVVPFVGDRTKQAVRGAINPLTWLQSVGVPLVARGGSAARRGRVAPTAPVVTGSSTNPGVPPHSSHDDAPSPGPQPAARPQPAGPAAAIPTAAPPRIDIHAGNQATPQPGNSAGPAQLRTITTAGAAAASAGAHPEDQEQRGEGEPFADLFKLYAQYEYLRQRYMQRQFGVSLRFNPYVVPGFPCVLLDSLQTKFHSVGYVQTVQHTAFAGQQNSGTISTSVSVTCARTFPEFIADIRNDAERFGGRVTAAPAELISEIREIIQDDGQAEVFYQMLFHGGQRPGSLPAAFHLDSAMGYTQRDGLGVQDIINDGATVAEQEQEIRAARLARQQAADNPAPADPTPPAPVVRTPTTELDIYREVFNIMMDAARTAAGAFGFDDRIYAPYLQAINRGERTGPPAVLAEELSGVIGRRFNSLSSGVNQAAAEIRSRYGNRSAAQLAAERNAANQPVAPAAVTQPNTPPRILSQNNLDPNLELSPKDTIYRTCFDSYHVAMQMCSRPVCTLNQYIRFWHGGRTVGDLINEGTVGAARDDFAYTVRVELDVNASAAASAPDRRGPAERRPATFYDQIYNLRPGPGTSTDNRYPPLLTPPAPEERGYTESADPAAVQPSSVTRGVPANYPQTRASWSDVLRAYARKVRTLIRPST